MPLSILTFAQLAPDEWLGNRLQKPTFRLKLDLSAPNPLAVENAQQCAQQWRSHLPTAAFCDTRIPCDRIDWLRTLESWGFGVVDTAITLEWQSRSSEFSSKGSAERSAAFFSTTSPATVRAAQPHDAQAVIALAGHAFRYSRFHLDPRVDDLTANRIKADWVANCCAGRRGDRLWVAEMQGKVVGFLAALVNPAAQASTAVLDLIAVDSAYQGQGIGRSLVIEFMQSYRDRCTLLQVGTQAANIAALRLYQSLGFVIAQSQYLLHYHAP